MFDNTYLEDMDPECDKNQVEYKLSDTGQHEEDAPPARVLFFLQDFAGLLT